MNRVGCDLASASEVEASIAAFGDRYLRRVFTDHEVSTCAGPRRGERLAARFAGKEACAKVLGDLTGSLPWTSIEIRSDPAGRPIVRLDGEAAAIADANGIGDLVVSLSHQGDLAMAVVVATAQPVVSGTLPVRRGEQR